MVVRRRRLGDNKQRECLCVTVKCQLSAYKPRSTTKPTSSTSCERDAFKDLFCSRKRPFISCSQPGQF